MGNFGWTEKMGPNIICLYTSLYISILTFRINCETLIYFKKRFDFSSDQVLCLCMSWACMGLVWSGAAPSVIRVPYMLLTINYKGKMKLYFLVSCVTFILRIIFFWISKSVEAVLLSLESELDPEAERQCHQAKIRDNCILHRNVFFVL